MSDERSGLDIAGIRRVLNRHGRRMTPQRAAILEALRATRTHPTAEQLYEDVQARLPRISLGTVYRNLSLLVEEGYARRLSMPGGVHRFDGDVSEHHHAFCERCGKVVDVYLDPDPALLRRVARRTGFRLAGRHIVFLGLCAGCREGGEAVS